MLLKLSEAMDGRSQAYTDVLAACFRSTYLPKAVHRTVVVPKSKSALQLNLVPFAYRDVFTAVPVIFMPKPDYDG